MTSAVAANPSLDAPGRKAGKEGLGRQLGRLPELSPVKEEHEERTASTQPDPEPSIPSAMASVQEKVASMDNLIEALALSGSSEESLSALLISVRREVMAALEELRAITTHDDNLERQYKEAVAENIQLHAELEKTRRENRHLRGQLSVLQMTSSEIRQERARIELRRRRKLEQERQVQLQRAKSFYPVDEVPVLSAAERARTVNAKGEYIDHGQPVKRGGLAHTRSSTYPFQAQTSDRAPLHPPSHSPPSGSKMEPLPPPLSGCMCSVCNAKQSLGALTLSKASQMTKSGQLILLGDRVIIKGERPGTVRYIGKLDFDILDHVYVGVHLDLPVGTCDGCMKGKRYFQCPPNHGVFIRPADVICVVGRKPQSGGTAIPRIRERLPTGIEISRAASQINKTPVGNTITPSLPSSRTTPSLVRAQARVEAELEILKDGDPSDLADESVLQMSHRMKALALKSKQRPPPPPPPELPPVDTQPLVAQARTPSPVRESPFSRPHAPEPPSPPTPPQPLPPRVSPPRAATPLQQTLLHSLAEKDLGNTGFVTSKELESALTAVLPPDKALTAPQMQQLFTYLGLPDTNEGVGISYESVVPHILTALSQGQ